MPEEIYSEKGKGKTAEEAILQQVLLFDIARQLRRPLLVASVDTAQCYDRISSTCNRRTDAWGVQGQTVVGSEYADTDPVDGVLPKDGLW